MRDQIYLFLWSLVKRETRYATFDFDDAVRAAEEEGGS